MTDSEEGPKRRKRRPQRRIAMVSTHGYVAADPPLGAPDTGGQVVYVLELSKRLAEFGFRVDVWTRRFENQPEIEKVNERVSILRMPCGGNGFIPKEHLHGELLEWGHNAYQYIREKNLKYYFINSHYWDAGLAGQGLAEAFGIPHVHTPHSIGTWKREQMEEDFPDSRESLDEKYNFTERIYHENRLYRACNLLVATTPIQKERIQSGYDIADEKIRMIPPGYDDREFFAVGEASRENIRELFGLSGHVVFSVGRLALNKGFDLLVRAFRLIAERDGQANLLLAIGHEERSAREEDLFQELLRLRASFGLEERIRFMGYIPSEDLPDYYRAADVFVLSSRYEPFGMTAVEAMACGTPTIVTEHGGLFRVLQHGRHVLFADPLYEDDLALTILKALRYTDLKKRLSDEGARMARSYFTWTGIAQQLLDTVESI